MDFQPTHPFRRKINRYRRAEETLSYLKWLERNIRHEPFRAMGERLKSFREIIRGLPGRARRMALAVREGGIHERHSPTTSHKATEADISHYDDNNPLGICGGEVDVSMFRQPSCERLRYYSTESNAGSRWCKEKF